MFMSHHDMGAVPHILSLILIPYIINRFRFTNLHLDECVFRMSFGFPQAGKLESKSTFPESANNSEMAKHMYYIGMHTFM